MRFSWTARRPVPMMDVMSPWKVLLVSFALTFASLTLLAAVLTVVPRLGRIGRQVSDGLARAPWLDVIVSLFTWVPWVVAAAAGGWAAFAGAIPAQMLAAGVWCMWHEFVHP